MMLGIVFGVSIAYCIIGVVVAHYIKGALNYPDSIETSKAELFWPRTLYLFKRKEFRKLQKMYK